MVDHGIMPRGGSRRRKSMEPRALVNANGSISAARQGRRTTSAEYMTSEMRDELINTPVRTYEPPTTRHSLGDDSLFGSSEISSTYNSPTTTMNVHHVATPTELVNWDPATSKTPAKSAGQTELDTPYLMKQGGVVMEHARENGPMSAPPKQIGEGLFGKENSNGDGQGEKMRLKLQEARRRTMGFKPVVGSPLGKF